MQPPHPHLRCFLPTFAKFYQCQTDENSGPKNGRASPGRCTIVLSVANQSEISGLLKVTFTADGARVVSVTASQKGSTGVLYGCSEGQLSLSGWATSHPGFSDRKCASDV